MEGQVSEQKEFYLSVLKEFAKEKVLNPKLSLRRFCGDKKANYLQTWRALKLQPKLMDTIRDEIRKRYSIDAIEVDAAVIEKAKKGDPRAADLFYRRHENWNQHGSGGNMEVTVVIPAYLLPMSKRPQGSEPITISTKPGGPEIINDTSEECCLILPEEKKGEPTED